MKVVAICYVFPLLLSVQGDARADDEPDRAPTLYKDLSWSINELVTTADLIVEARLERVDKRLSFERPFGRCLVMNIERTITGNAPGPPTYLVAPALALERRLSAPFFFEGPKYLLFLVHDANTAKAAAELETDPDNVFSVSGRWRGAVALEPRCWPEVCNKLLDARGLLPPELRRGAEPSQDSGRTTIETVQDMVAYRRPVPEGDPSASDDKRAAMNRLKASEHPWAREFIRGMAKIVPD